MEVGGKIILKAGLNMACPGSGSSVDFYEAVKDLCNGNYISASINVCTGLYDLYSLGLYSAAKEAAKGSAKQASINMAKQACKESNKRIGEEAAKKIAQGAPKKVTAELSKLAAGRAQKDLGTRLGKDIASGFLGDATEEAFKQSSKTAALKAAGLSFLGSGGKDAKNAMIDGAIEGMKNKFFVENILKLSKSPYRDAATKAAKSVANDFFEDAFKRDLVVNSGKGIANRFLV